MDIIVPDELLQEIFHRLPPPSSSAVSAVSRRWRHLLRSSLSVLTLRLSPTHPPLTAFSSFLSDHTHLSSLSVTTTTTVTTATTAFSDDLLTAIAAACPHLTHLRLSTGPVSLLPLLSLSTSCHNLSSLSITLCRPLIHLQFLSSFIHLKTLTLILVGNSSPELISDHRTSGTELRLQLQSLCLTGIRAGDYALNWLWRNCSHKTLSKLVLENCEGVGDNHSFSCFINGLKNLHEAELKTCRSIASLILLKLAENRSDCLSSLLIYDGVNRESLLQFIRETTCDLHTLDLRLPLDLDDTHLIEISTKFNRLRVLRLQSCCMVTGEGLKTLGLALSDHLEELALTNCDLIKRQSGFLVELAQSLHNIKILDLSYNHTLLDKELTSMISSCCGLRTLRLRGCSRLTDVSLISLCKNCKRLESVDVVYCNGIQVEGVEFMILNALELRNLQVEDCKLSEAARRWMRDRFIEVQQ